MKSYVNYLQLTFFLIDLESTIGRIEHETYMLCYLVLMNASVIPGNGYRKSELELFIKKLRMLKLSVKQFVDTASHHPGNWNCEVKGLKLYICLFQYYKY